MLPDFKNHFSKEADLKVFTALKCISESEKPLGSWILKEKMEEKGESISLASVGRLLKEMDRQGLTVLIQTQGRALTQEGNRQLEVMEKDFARLEIEEEMKEATHPESPQDIIDLLKVRMLIESELIKLIIQNASDEEIELLEEAVKSHEHHISEDLDVESLPINFHGVLSKISTNRFLNSILKLLIHEELKLEEKFPDIALKLREAHHLAEHEHILMAVKERDVDLAVHEIKKHIQKLIESVTD